MRMDMDMDKVRLTTTTVRVMAARGGIVRTTTEVLVVAVGTVVEDAEERVVSAVERVAQIEGNLDAARRRPPWGVHTCFTVYLATCLLSRRNTLFRD